MSNRTSKLEVLQVVPSLAIGGAEAVATSLAIGLRNQGIPNQVVSLYNATGSRFEQELDAADIHPVYLAKRRGPDLHVLFRLARLIDAWKPKIVHTHLYAEKYALGAILAARSYVPLVHTCHSMAEQEFNRHDQTIQRLAMRTHRATIVAVSEAVQKSVVQTYGSAAVPVISNGIDLEKFSPKHSSYREPNRAVFVNVANFTPAKNHATLVHAFDIVHKRYPCARLLLVGAGPLVESTHDLVDQLGLADAVTFAGATDDVSGLLHAADVFVLSSLWEGFSMSLLEAAACGLPIVATAVGGNPEIVRDGLNGFLVLPQNPEKLAAAMLQLATNPDMREAMGRASRARAQEFSTTRMVQEYLQLYEALIHDRKS